MRNTIYRYFFKEFISLFALMLISISIIVWVVQAVNYLDFVTDDGHSFGVYFSFLILNMPKVLSRLIPMVFLISLLATMLQFEKNNELFYTNVSCHLLDTNSCKCKDYENRKKLVPDCVKLTPKNLNQLDWMPNTCAYKLIHEGKELPDWHPLIQKTSKDINMENYSVAKRVISEKDINMEKITDYIFDWEKEE